MIKSSMESGVMEFSHVTNHRHPKMVSYLLNPFVVWSFSSQSIIFQSFGDVIIAGEGLQILTYDRH